MSDTSLEKIRQKVGAYRREDWDPHLTKFMFSVAEADALLAAIDELTASRDHWEQLATQRHVAVNGELSQQVDELTAQRDAVLALHFPIADEPTDNEADCHYDGESWPCETVRAYGVEP